MSKSTILCNFLSARNKRKHKANFHMSWKICLENPPKQRVTKILSDRLLVTVTRLQHLVSLRATQKATKYYTGLSASHPLQLYWVPGPNLI